jgi:hypothetical protein
MTQPTIVIDCGTGQISVVPLTDVEQVDFDARLAAAPGVAAAEAARRANGLTLQQRAQAALARNAAYLALPTPTLVDQAAQVALLTRECSALIRLLLNALDSVGGT